MSSTWIGLALILAILVWSYFRLGKVSAPWLEPFKALLPSWRFFDALGTSFILEAKHANQSVYTPLLVPTCRQFSQVFFNPKGNLTHAQNSLVQIWVQNPNNPKIQKAFLNMVALLSEDLLPKSSRQKTIFRVRALCQKTGQDEVVYASEL